MVREIGTVDVVGTSIKELNREVAEEAEVIYDLVYKTFLETFTEPLTTEEVRDLLERLDANALLQMINEDPDEASRTLEEMRKLGIGVTA